MLKSWSIENFKPIVNSGELKLAPVTVFAGLNSSGKSSLLQSILMISQTLSSRVLDRPLLANGPIVQLGTFENVLNEKSRSRTLTFGFELEVEEAVQGLLPTPTLVDIKLVKVTVKISSANGASYSAIEAAKAVVDKVSIEVTSESEAEEMGARKFDVVVEKIKDADLSHFLRNVAQDYLRLIPYSGEQANYLGEFKVDEERVGERIPERYLVALSHFLPARFIHSFKIEDRSKPQWEQAVNYLFEFTNYDAVPRHISDYLKPDEPISKRLRKTIDELLKEEKIADPFSARSLRELVNWYRSLSVKTRDKKMALAGRIKGAIMQGFQASLKTDADSSVGLEGLEFVANDRYVEGLHQAVGQITSVFTSKIRYLGPLRADPQASQKFSMSNELDNVGTKGEYAAAVYDANQNARIEWYNPFTEQVEQSILKEALDSWSRYLGVAHQVKIEAAGQSGFSWQVVHHEGQKSLPLSSVGVGVSQILPILVMGLLAPKNSLLIIEQPELHLHPRVQSRLGDFFVGLAKCKKQCLIETHSENLVNQLRYHIVEAGGQEMSDCEIYFVDQDETGAARFEAVEISPSGNILNWPDGFFDETMRQEDQIASESIRRRANAAKHG